MYIVYTVYVSHYAVHLKQSGVPHVNRTGGNILNIYINRKKNSMDDPAILLPGIYPR